MILTVFLKICHTFRIVKFRIKLVSLQKRSRGESKNLNYTHDFHLCGCFNDRSTSWISDEFQVKKDSEKKYYLIDLLCSIFGSRNNSCSNIF